MAFKPEPTPISEEVHNASAPRWFISLLVFLGTLAIPLSAQQQAPSSKADSLYQQGVVAVQSGDLNRARAAFEQLVKLAPASAEGHNLLGWVLLSQGQTAEAIRSFGPPCDSNLVSLKHI